MKLSPQKEIIVSILRDRNWHCGSEWLNRIKDDRKRIGELKEYMASKNYEIIGEPCKGICGNKGCPLYKRRAVPLKSDLNAIVGTSLTQHDYRKAAAEMVKRFDAGLSAELI